MTAPAPPPSAAIAGPVYGARGALYLMTFGVLLIPGMDAVAKLLGPDGAVAGLPPAPPMAPAQIAWIRFIGQAIVLAALLAALKGGWGRFTPKRPMLAALRGVLIATATVLFFTALQSMPMADAIAIFFVEPLIVTLLSALFLQERLTLRRLGAVALGLTGAAIVIQPNFEAAGWVALLPLGTALCFAVYILLTKTLAQEENVLTLQLWAGLSGAAFLGALIGGAAALSALRGPSAAAYLTPVLVWPTPTQWALLATLILLAVVGHLSIVVALRHAPAARLAPLQYLEIVSAAALGYALFGDAPSAVAWVGIALIIAAGALVLHDDTEPPVVPPARSTAGG